VILKAAWIVPVTTPPVRYGYVEVQGDRIVALGPIGQRSLPPPAVADLGDVVLVPGLVNPHTHLELGCYAGRLDPAPLWVWLEQLVRLRRGCDRSERERQAASDGARQSLQAGVTCIGDISRENVAWRPLKNVPIRKVCFVELLTLADQPPRDPDELRSAVAAVEEDPLLTVGVSPHAPYTVPAPYIQAALSLACELGRPWCIHWAESSEEVAFLREGPKRLPFFLRVLLWRHGITSPRLPPMEFLDRCCEGAKPGALAHVNYIDDRELERLAAAGHTVVYCPRAHHFFGHPPHPLPLLRRAGVPVALGTDSLASNESLSVLDEAHHVYTRVPDAPSPHELLRMVTLDGAWALGLADQIGSLEVGKQADLAAFPCAPDERDPIAALITRPAPPSAVWVAGRRVT